MITQTDINKLYTKFKVKEMSQKDEKREIDEITKTIHGAMKICIESLYDLSTRGLGNISEEDLNSLKNKVKEWSKAKI